MTGGLTRTKADLGLAGPPSFESKICDRCDTSFILERDAAGWRTVVRSSPENFGSESSRLFSDYETARRTWQAESDCGCVEVD